MSANNEQTNKKTVDKKNNSNKNSEVLETSKVENDYNKFSKEALTQYGAAEENDDYVPTPKGAKEKFFNFCDKFGDLFVLNLLFIITSIPIFTIGASFTAMYSVTLKMVENKEGVARKQYIKYFKSNFKAATKVWLINLIFLAFLYYLFATTVGVVGTAANVKVVIVGFGMLLLTFELPMVFPLIARYENTTWNYIKNAMLICVSKLGLWFRIFFLWVFLPIMYYLRPALMYYTWYFWILINVSAICYFTSISIMKYFHKLEENQAKKENESADEESDSEEKTED